MAQKYNYYRPEEEGSKVGTAGKFLLGLMGGGTVGSSIEEILEEKRKKKELGRERRQEREQDRVSREYEETKLKKKRDYQEEQAKKTREADFKYWEKRYRPEGEDPEKKEPDWGKELTAISKDISNVEEATPEMLDLQKHVQRNYYKSIKYTPPYRPPPPDQPIPIDENNLPTGNMTEIPPEFVMQYLSFFKGDPVKAKEAAEKNGWIIPDDEE